MRALAFERVVFFVLSIRRIDPFHLHVDGVTYLLHVSLDGMEHGGVGDFAQGSNSGSAEKVILPSHVLCQRRGHDNNILGNVRHFLNGQRKREGRKGLIRRRFDPFIAL